MQIKMKRIYEDAEPSDGKRILVDRLWPRGISKERANLDLWLKDIAPSSELRKSFQHKPEKFKMFKEAYRKELREDPEKIAAVEELLLFLKHENITLLYGAKDEIHNHAVVLKHYLTKDC